MSDDMRDLFTRDIDRIDLPPAAAWTPGARRHRSAMWSGFVALPAAVGVIALALVVAFVIQLVRGDLPMQVAKSPSPSPSASASMSSATPTPSAIGSRSPGASASATSTALPASNAVHVSSTLPATGQWALILNRGFIIQPNAQGQLVETGVARDSIRAVSVDPAARGATIPLVDYVGSVAGTGVDNVLREQFSPDGRRLVLSVLDGETRDARLMLVVVDLVAGTAGTLTNDANYHDAQPAWSPRGDEIAFVRRARSQGAGNNDLGIWGIRPDGTGLHRILTGSASSPESTGLFGWSGDGAGIGFARGFEGSQYNVVDTASGRVASIGDRSAQGRDMADWRLGSPAFVGAFMEGPRGGRQYLVVADANGANARVVVTGDATDGNTFFQQPRWRPGSSDILFIRTAVDTSASTAVATLFVTDPTGKTPRQVAEKRSACSPSACGRTFAAWTSDGNSVVYLYGFGVGGELHQVRADGQDDRVLQGFGGVPEAHIEWLDLTVLSL